jgi:hypothetical protein
VKTRKKDERAPGETIPHQFSVIGLRSVMIFGFAPVETILTAALQIVAISPDFSQTEVWARTGRAALGFN